MSYSYQRYWSSLRVFKSFAAWMECFFFHSFEELLFLLILACNFLNMTPITVASPCLWVTLNTHGQEFDMTKLSLCLKGFPQHWPIMFFFKMKSRYVRYLKNKLEPSTVLWSWYEGTLGSLWQLRLWYCFPQLHAWFLQKSFTG